MQGSGDSVLGHYSVLGGSLQPLLSESSPLFKAIVEDDLETVRQAVALQPHGSPTAEPFRIHNVLHWNSNEEGSAGEEACTADGSSQGRKPATSVHVKQRSLLVLAALHAAQSGRTKVMCLLLEMGADPRQRMPGDHQSAFTIVQQVGGEYAGEVMTMLQHAALNCEAGSCAADLAGNASSNQHSPTNNNAAGQHNHSLQPSGSSSSRLMDPLFATLNGSGSGFEVAAPSSSSDQDSAHGNNNNSNPAFPLSVDLQHHLSLHQDVDLDMFSPDGLPYSTAEITQPEYSTDDFRMFAFKVLRCSKRFAHDWRACPFAHPTENARRRDPREFRYCAIACPDYKQGFCVRGDLCQYAHGVFEAWLHPSRYRTQLCKDGANCHRPICFFAHSLQELRTPTYTWTPTSESSTPQAAAAGNSGFNSGSNSFDVGSSSQACSLPMSGRSSNTNTNNSYPNSTPTHQGSGGRMQGQGNGSVQKDPRSPPNSAKSHANMGGGDNKMMSQQAGGGPRGRNDPGMAAANAAGAVAPLPPGAAAAAMFGFTAPRMSNAFARRHGLNPKDNAMLNLQKIALQAQATSTPSNPSQEQHMGRMLQSNQASVNPVDFQSNAGMGGMSMYGGHALSAQQQPRSKGGYSGQLPQSQQQSNQLMMQYGYGAPNGLMAMQVAAASHGDPSALAALNHHLASLTLHPHTAAAAAAAYASSQAAAVSMGGMGNMGLSNGMMQAYAHHSSMAAGR